MICPVCGGMCDRAIPIGGSGLFAGLRIPVCEALRKDEVAIEHAGRWHRVKLPRQHAPDLVRVHEREA